MKIKVNSYTVAQDELLKAEGLNIVRCMKLKETIGYDGLITNGMLFYDHSDAEAAKLNIITNNYDLAGATPDKTLEIDLTVPDVLSTETMPEFGMTIDGNIQAIQLNLPMKLMDKLFDTSIQGFWGFDEKYYVANETYDKTLVERDIRLIANKGYFAPVVIQCDSMIQAIYNERFYCLSKLLNKSVVPARVLTYVDYLYVASMDHELYDLITNIPENLCYHPVNDMNYQEHFLWNYSDKRAILKQYADHKRPIADGTTKVVETYEQVDIDKWFPIYYYIMDSTYTFSNTRLIARLKKEDTDIVVGTNGSEVGPLHSEASSYLNGYRKRIETDDTGKWIEIDPENMDNYEVYKELDHVDVSDLPIIAMSYNGDNDKVFEKLLKAYDADLIISSDDKSAIIGLNNLPELLRTPTAKVKYIRHKNH